MPHVQRSWRAYVRCISIVFQLPDSTVGDVVQLVRTLPCHNPSVGLSLESSLRFSSNFHRQTLTHAKTAKHSQYERLSILLIPLGVGRSRLLALGQVPVTNRLLQLLGSASEYLVRLSPLSVFLIPMNSTEAPAWQAIAQRASCCLHRTFEHHRTGAYPHFPVPKIAALPRVHPPKLPMYSPSRAAA